MDQYVTDSVKIQPTLLAQYKPTCQRKPTKREVELLQLAFGYRCCSTSIWDRIIDYYLLALVAAILFIILSLDWVNRGLSQCVQNFWAQLIIKALIIFIVIYLLDRWLVSWRQKNVLCTIDG